MSYQIFIKPAVNQSDFVQDITPIASIFTVPQ